MNHPYIWVPKFKIYEPPAIGGMKVKMAGRFKLNAVRPDGKTVRKSTGWFDNLILDAGLNAMGTSNQIGGCHVGTGTTAPNVGQSTLVSRIASTGSLQASSSGVQVSTVPYYGYKSWTYRFAQGAAAGNVSEVGVSNSSTTFSPLWSRALIVDDFGAPTTITVLSDEFLDVTYELRIMIDTADYASTVTIASVVYDVVVRPLEIDQAIYWADYLGSAASPGNQITASPWTFSNATALGSVTGTPTGATGNTTSSMSYASYVDSSLTKTATGSIGLNSGNFTGGIKALTVWAVPGGWQISFDNGGAGIPKTSSKLFSLTASIMWGRYY